MTYDDSVCDKIRSQNVMLILLKGVDGGIFLQGQKDLPCGLSRVCIVSFSLHSGLQRPMSYAKQATLRSRVGVCSHIASSPSSSLSHFQALPMKIVLPPNSFCIQTHAAKASTSSKRYPRTPDALPLRPTRALSSTALEMVVRRGAVRSRAKQNGTSQH